LNLAFFGLFSTTQPIAHLLPRMRDAVITTMTRIAAAPKAENVGSISYKKPQIKGPVTNPAAGQAVTKPAAAPCSS
jgi:hypothetical protein